MNSILPPFLKIHYRRKPLIFSPATADEFALKASLDNHNVNLYTVFSNDVDDEAEFRIDLWEDELWAARRAFGRVLCFEDWLLWIRRGYVCLG